MLFRNNGNGLNGRVSATSPPTIHGHLHHQTTADESSLQSNSNSEDFSDEGIDPSRGLVSSVASQPSCQSKSYHQDDTITKNPQRIVLTPSANQTPSSAIRNRFKVIPRSGTTDEEDPYGPMAGNFYPTVSRSHRSTTPGEFHSLDLITIWKRRVFILIAWIFTKSRVRKLKQYFTFLTTQKALKKVFEYISSLRGSVALSKKGLKNLFNCIICTNFFRRRGQHFVRREQRHADVRAWTFLCISPAQPQS